MNAHLIEIRYNGATDTRGSQVALISKRFPKDRVAEGYNSTIGNTCRQGEAMLTAMGYTVICSMEHGDVGYMAAVKEFMPLKEGLAQFLKNPKRNAGEPMSDFKPKTNEASAPILDERELATILAALRYWQDDQIKPKGFGGRSNELMEISTNREKFENLSAAEIDTLAERINR